MLKKMDTLKQPEAGALIHQLRLLTALSQEQFAAVLGVAYCTVNRWENGHIQPSGLALKQILAMLYELQGSSELLLQEQSQQLLERYFQGQDPASDD
ncbi:MAG: helix-turn-helix domain-containing protein [Cyanobacteria bacterium Co-bin13]|nr:helix-turn-helix domain-containing protein [Cyanobacteria bacterium Co-bin13]